MRDAGCGKRRTAPYLEICRTNSATSLKRGSGTIASVRESSGPFWPGRLDALADRRCGSLVAEQEDRLGSAPPSAVVVVVVVVVVAVVVAVVVTRVCPQCSITLTHNTIVVYMRWRFCFFFPDRSAVWSVVGRREGRLDIRPLAASSADQVVLGIRGAPSEVEQPIVGRHNSTPGQERKLAHPGRDPCLHAHPVAPTTLAGTNNALTSCRQFAGGSSFSHAAFPHDR